MQHAVRNIQSFRHRLETVHVCFGIRPVRFPDLCVFRTCAFSGIRLFFLESDRACSDFRDVFRESTEQ